jgi:hypothetical protein
VCNRQYINVDIPCLPLSSHPSYSLLNKISLNLPITKNTSTFTMASLSCKFAFFVPAHAFSRFSTERPKCNALRNFPIKTDINC